MATIVGEGSDATLTVHHHQLGRKHLYISIWVCVCRMYVHVKHLVGFSLGVIKVIVKSCANIIYVFTAICTTPGGIPSTNRGTHCIFFLRLDQSQI